jgi:voltage-gated potassium channel
VSTRFIADESDRASASAVVRRYAITATLILGITLVGVLGYRFIEGFAWIDAIYMTVITLSTVGFHEVQPLTTPGKLFTIALIATGIGLVLTIIGMWARGVIEGELQDLFGRRRRARTVRRMDNHYIICGFGHFGRRVAEEFRRRGVAFVVIEHDENLSAGVPAIVGDATHDAVLKEAGIERARGVISTMSSEAANLYITLAARELNPRALVIARCEDEANAERFLRAGAARVISPYAAAGARMAQAALHPRMLEFLDLATGGGEAALGVAEISVGEGSVWRGRTLGALDLERRYGVTVVGVASAGGSIDPRPGQEHALEAGEMLLVFGARDALERIAAEAGS